MVLLPSVVKLMYQKEDLLVVMVEKDYGVVINSQEMGEKVFASLTALASYIREQAPGKDA